MDKVLKYKIWTIAIVLAIVTGPCWFYPTYWLVVQPISQDLELKSFSRSIQLPPGSTETSRRTEIKRGGSHGWYFEVRIQASVSDKPALDNYLVQLNQTKFSDPEQFIDYELNPIRKDGPQSPGIYEVVITKVRVSNAFEVD